MANRLRKPMWRIDWLFRLVAPKTYEELQRNIKFMQNFTKDVIEKRRNTLANKIQNTPEQGEIT